MELPELFKPDGMRVVVLCGGPGAERSVSLASGEAVAAALRDVGCSVLLQVLHGVEIPEGLNPDRDILLPLVHGTFGEDGGLGRCLDAKGFVYGGSTARSSALAFDKVMCKQRVAEAGIPVARDVTFACGEPIVVEVIRDAVGIPCVLKPALEGSSVGLHILMDDAQCHACLPMIAERPMMAETYFAGTDVTVAILGDRVLGSVSIHPEGDIYDYEHKYTPGLTRYASPAEVEPPLIEKLEACALETFRILGCRDLARVDFRVGPDGDFIFLELNTLPGMTATSLFPMAAKMAGLSFEGLLWEWVVLVAKRLKGIQK